MRKTKIVCTIGPKSESKEMLTKLVKAGMNVARLNFSHGDHEEHLKRIKTINEVNSELGTFVAIMLDTKGPEIRVGDMGSGIDYKKGDKVKVTLDNIVGTKESFQINSKELFKDINVGNIILMDDGNLSMKVLEKVNSKNIICQFLNDGRLTTKKSANVPNVKIDLPFISEKDDSDIRFACKNGVDFIASSFTRRKEDIRAIRKILKEENNESIQIIAKIENQEGFDNLDEILDEADGIMVARGDLGVEVPYSLVPLYQKEMIKKANEKGKPVITATQMLESMVNNPRSTRAETSDVANAVLDGSDCLMLSAESAKGKYPVEAVKTMAEIAEKAEAMLDYTKYAKKSASLTNRSLNEAIGIAVSESCLTLENVSAVIAFTETGGTAKRIARFRPIAPVYAATNHIDTAKHMSIYFGVYPVLNDDILDFDTYDKVAREIACEKKLKKGSMVIMTSGYKVEHGSTNTIRFLEVK